MLISIEILFFMLLLLFDGDKQTAKNDLNSRQTNGEREHSQPPFLISFSLFQRQSDQSVGLISHEQRDIQHILIQP